MGQHSPGTARPGTDPRISSIGAVVVVDSPK